MSTDAKFFAILFAICFVIIFVGGIEMSTRLSDARAETHHESLALERFQNDNTMLEQQFRDMCEEEPKPRHSSCKWFLENYSTRG